jgi:DnaJ-domain-containing protein 1
MQDALGLVIGIIMATGLGVLLIYWFNRPRCTLEQILQQTDCTEAELRTLRQGKFITYRRQYVLTGPYTFDLDEVEQAHHDYHVLQRVKAENRAMLKKMAEESAAEIAEANRRYEEQLRATQEELERMRRAYEHILRTMGISHMPDTVIAALRVLGLPQDASFDQVRQQYRTLAKRYHPDRGGDATRFIQIDGAYKAYVTWLQSQSV